MRRQKLQWRKKVWFCETAEGGCAGLGRAWGRGGGVGSKWGLEGFWEGPGPVGLESNVKKEKCIVKCEYPYCQLFPPFTDEPRPIE
jgi:hypothetical protein